MANDVDNPNEMTGASPGLANHADSEGELKKRLRQQTAIARFGSYALGEPEIDRVVRRSVEIAAEILDIPLAKVLQLSNGGRSLHFKAGIGWRDGLVGETRFEIALTSQAGFTLLNDGPVIVQDLRTESRFASPAMLHEHDVRSGMSAIISGNGGKPFGVIGVFSRELRRFDEADVDFLVALANIIANSVRHNALTMQQAILIRELVHRAGNMLQVVSSIANQTITRATDSNYARRKFSERLSVLGRANHIVADGGWTSTRFSTVLHEVLRPHLPKLILHGDDILLPADLCFDLGLVLHEIASNSNTYGVLASDAGEVKIDWTLLAGPNATDLFSFVWNDTIPSRHTRERGFGSRLFQAVIERKWGGTIKVEKQNAFSFAFDIPDVNTAGAGRAWVLPDF